jgi:hypothetical protein
MNQSNAIEGVIKELQSSNLSQDLILDTVDSFGYTLASNIAKEGTAIMPKLVEIATDIKSKFDVLIRSNVVLAKRLTENKLQEREDRGELLDTLKDLKPEQTKEKIEKKERGGKLGIFGIAAATIAFLPGLVTGFLKELFSGIVTKIKSTKAYAAISKTISGFFGIFTKFGKFVDDAITKFKGSTIGKAIKSISNILGKMKGLFQIFSNSPIVPALSGLVKTVTSVFGVISNILSGLKSGFASGMKIGKMVGNVVKSIIGFLKPLGRLIFGLGKIFGLPLTIIMGLVGAITGFISGFKEDGLIGGLKGALVGIFDSLVGSLLDLLKDGVSWVAGALGFENFSKFLDSFSFTGLFKQFVDWAFGIYAKIGDFLGGIFTAIGDFFSNLPEKFSSLFSGAGDAVMGLFSNMGETLDKFNRTILKAILPDPNAKREWYNPLNLIKEAIPDKVYEYAYGSAPSKSAEMVQSKKQSFDTSTDAGKLQKARAAGYNSWKEYKESDWAWKTKMPTVMSNGDKIMTMPSSTGAALSAAGNVSSATSINVVNNNGGNVSNVRSNSVNNNVPTQMPIYTGSFAMGY